MGHFYFLWQQIVFKKNEKALASVEATQSATVLFALIGEIIILKIKLPDVYSIAGLVLVIVGMLLHSFKKEKTITKVDKQ